MSRLVDDERGQTVLDYAIGVGIFLVAVTFVVATIPGMFAPFVGAGDAQIADRVATSLSTERLGSPDEQYLLDRSCTVAFFEQLDGGAAVPADCRFDSSATTIQEMFALDDGQAVQITVENASGGAAVVDGTTLSAGDDPPSSVSVTTARRTVAIDGTTYWLEVRAW
ncbi:hypothetical protein SY89_02158 [Halolamina pelagica]|uniref:Uncharacterized protein n=1 Tax=Halolamina pelagica TaxID=699431 RepID=A0A0P7H049_9EURY|nr:hypothetical protein [Halolamina pelagica]KPN31412.1 hypothetical protein SY89_02158 [Halolamina pelagica]